MTAASPDAWAALADLQLKIESYEVERLSREFANDLARVTTRVRLSGGGEEGSARTCRRRGRGRDAARDGPVLALAGEWTLASFCEHLRGVEQWTQPSGTG